MIISLTKEDDKDTLRYILNAIELEIGLYQKTEDVSLLVHIQELTNWYDRLKVKVDTHDYTKEDTVRVRVDKTLHDFNKHNRVCHSKNTTRTTGRD